MTKALWNDTVLAESADCIVVEGNRYFPEDSINKEFFRESNYHTTCSWKGEANYYSVNVNGKINENAAWYYPNPKKAAKNIENYIAFWKGVKIED